MLFPERGPLPQTSQTCAMRCSRRLPMCGQNFNYTCTPASPANHRGHDGQFIRGWDKGRRTTLTNSRPAVLFSGIDRMQAEAGANTLNKPLPYGRRNIQFGLNSTSKFASQMETVRPGEPSGSPIFWQRRNSGEGIDCGCCRQTSVVGMVFFNLLQKCAELDGLLPARFDGGLPARGILVGDLGQHLFGFLCARFQGSDVLLQMFDQLLDGCRHHSLLW